MVKVYDDVIPSGTCENLIKIFESDSHHHEFVNHDHKPCFHQLNLNIHHPHLVASLVNLTKVAYDKYKKDLKNPFMPKWKFIEEFRLKRYNTSGEERFDEHVDVDNYNTAKRAVAFIFYLNDNDGETQFTMSGERVKPECGRVTVFPPTWEYPHAGLPPTDNTKYILSTYIHYG